MTDFQLTARIIPEPLPSVEAPAEHLTLIICDRHGVPITDIPNRKGVSFSEPLNTPGSCQVTIPLKDPILQDYPQALNYGNIVQYWLGDVCPSGMRIKSKGLTFVSDGEEVALAITLSGPTVHHMLNDFIVMHDGPPRPNSGGSRLYSWASRKGEWYNDSDWDDPFQVWSKKNPPTPAKRHNPKHWRVPSAKWLGTRGKWKYWRGSFNIAEEGTHVRIYASSDEWFKLYLDGEEVLDDKHREVGYKSYVQCDQVLSQGSHIIGVQQRSFPSPHGDGWDNLIVAVCKVNKRNRRILPPIMKSSRHWKVHKGNPPPSWNRAQVLRSMVNEAKARGVDAALDLTLGFSESIDSNGKAWRDRFNEEVQIGAQVLDAQAQLSEGGNFDVWVNPIDLTLKAYVFRGVDRSASIALIPGVNLRDYEVDETDEVFNSVYTQYDGGWFTANFSASQSKYGKRETFASLDNIKNESTARTLMDQILRNIGRTNKRAGSPEVKSSPQETPGGSIIPVEGMYPFIDFRTGDIITALNAQGVPSPHRVMNLTCTEDDNMNLSFDIELEEMDRTI